MSHILDIGNTGTENQTWAVCRSFRTCTPAFQTTSAAFMSLSSKAYPRYAGNPGLAKCQEHPNSQHLLNSKKFKRVSQRSAGRVSRTAQSISSFLSFRACSWQGFRQRPCQSNSQTIGGYGSNKRVPTTPRSRSSGLWLSSLHRPASVPSL